MFTHSSCRENSPSKSPLEISVILFPYSTLRRAINRESGIQGKKHDLDLFRMVKSPETSMDDFRKVQQIGFSKRPQSVAQTSDWILFSLELKLLHQRSVIKDLKQKG